MNDAPDGSHSQVEQLKQQIADASKAYDHIRSLDMKAASSKMAGERTHADESTSMDPLTTYRLDQHDKQFDRLEAKLDGISAALTDIKVSIAGQPTRSDVRNWMLALAGLIIGTVIAAAGFMLTASGNQLSAFQAGLSSVQTAVAAKPTEPAAAAKSP